MKIDTGVIVNRIIKDLPDCIKRGFRVAKYLSQFCIRNKEHTRYKQDLFGY